MSYLDDHNRHTVYVQRLATELLNSKLYPSLREAYLAARRILLESEEITSIVHLNRITSAINRAVSESTEKPWLVANSELAAFAVYEAGFYASLIEKNNDVKLRVPALEKIQRYVERSLLSLQSGNRVTAGMWGDLVTQNKNSVMSTFDNAVRAGYANGETVRQMVGRMRTATDGFLKNELESLVRTGVQHYAMQARQAMAADNKNVIAREVPIVTFDNRTSLTCLSHASNYGVKGWPAGESPIGYPPYHHNCRTSLAYLVKGQEELEGMRTAVSGKKGEEAKEAFEKRQGRTDGKVKFRGRKDLDKFDVRQINAATPVDSWLKSQPRWYVDSLLGKKRSDLFLKGDLKLSKFTDLTGDPLTLNQLRVADSSAFSQAGL